MPPITKIKFTDLNPYKSSLETIRFVSNVDKQIYNFFYAIFPTNGLQQTTINLLFARLHAKCIELGITPGSPNSDTRFLELITGIRLEFSGGAGERVNGTTERPNDRGAVATSNPTAETASNSLPIIPRTVGKRKQRSVGGKTGQGNKSK